MSVGRKSSGIVTTYDPVTGWKARAWALLAYLAVLAAVAGIVLFAVRYEPLSAANFASGPVTDPSRNVVRVGYTNGGTFSFGFLLANDGPLPIEIEGMHLSGRNELLIPVRFETAAKRYAGSLVAGDDDLEKLVPFTLPAGDRRWVVVRTRFGNCGRFAAGDATTYTRFQVTYKVLGITKRTWVSLPKDIRVESPSDAGCPARAA